MVQVKASQAQRKLNIDKEDVTRYDAIEAKKRRAEKPIPAPPDQK